MTTASRSGSFSSRLGLFLHNRRLIVIACLLFAAVVCYIPRRLDPGRSFQDTRTVTYSIDCVEQGKDPYVDTCDPWLRLYNYPPIWLQLRHLGIDSHQTKILGVTFGLLSVTTCLYLFRAVSMWPSVLAVFAIFSFPVFNAVREGNIEQVIFAMLVGGMAWSGLLSKRLQDWARGFLLVLLTILKVFPIVGAVLLLREKRGVLKFVVAVAVSGVAVVFASQHRLAQLLRNTPHDTTESFGGYTTVMLGWEILHGTKHALAMEHPLATFAMLFFAVLGFVAFVCGVRYRAMLVRLLPSLDGTSTRESLAIVGLAIYCGAFVISSSYDYRLMFLLPALSALLDDTLPANQRRTHVSPVAYLFVVGMILPYFSWVRPTVPLRFSISLFHAAFFLVSAAWLGLALSGSQDRMLEWAFARLSRGTPALDPAGAPSRP